MVVVAKFQMDPQQDVVRALLPGRTRKSEYATLPQINLVIQFFSLAVPVAVMAYQLLIAFDMTCG